MVGIVYGYGAEPPKARWAATKKRIFARLVKPDARTPRAACSGGHETVRFFEVRGDLVGEIFGRGEQGRAQHRVHERPGGPTRIHTQRELQSRRRAATGGQRGALGLAFVEEAIEKA